MSIVEQTLQCTKKCNFKKILEQIRSDAIPNIPGYEDSKVLELQDDGENITKIMRRKLPISKMASMALGTQHGVFECYIKYDQNKIVIYTSNPEIFKRYFEYSETVTIMDNKDGTINIIRESKTINHTSSNIVKKYFAGNIEDKYHHECMFFIECMVDICK